MGLQNIFTKESIGRSTAILVAFNVMENLGLVVRGIVFARWLGPTEYGVFSLAFFFIPLAVALAKLGIPSSFARYIPRYEMRNALRDFLKRTYTLILIGGLFLVLLGLLGVRPLSQFIYGSEKYTAIILLCVLSILPDTCKESLSATFAGLRVFLLDAVLRFSQFLLFTVSGILLVLSHAKTGAILTANLAATTLVVVLFSLLLKRYLDAHPAPREVIREPRFYRTLFHFSVFFVIAPVVYLMFSYSDRWILSRLTDLANVGIYSVGSRVSGFIYTFGVIMGTVLIPNLSKIWELGDKARVHFLLNLFTKANILVLLFGATAVVVLKDYLVPLFYGPEYLACLPIISMLLVFWLFQCINVTIATYASLLEQTFIPLLCNSAGLILNVVLNFILIPKMGIMGAAVASVAASALILLMLLTWFHRQGLEVKRTTLAACLLPFLVLLPPWPSAAAFALLVLVSWRTEWILNREERQVLAAQVKKGLARFTGIAPAET